jgi:hypothetical protein
MTPWAVDGTHRLRNISRTSTRPECRYQTNHAPPTANGSTRPQAAPAAPSGGNGPKPKIRIGEIAMCASTLATSTPAGSAMLPVPRTALPMKLRMQIAAAPPSAT